MIARIALFGRSTATDVLRSADLGMQIDWLEDPEAEMPFLVAVMAETVPEPLQITQQIHSKDMRTPVLILRQPAQLPQWQARIVTAVGIGNQVEVLDSGDTDALLRTLQRALKRSMQKQHFEADLKRADAGLKANPAHLPENQDLVTTLLEALPIAILAVDSRQRVIYANRLAQQLSNIDFDEPGRPWSALLSRDAAQRADALVSAALQHGNRGTVVLDHQHPLQGLRHLELTVLPNADPTRPDAALLLLQDITERQKAEQAYQQSLEALAEADRAKSQFLATVSHEIRTPLHGILALLELHGNSRLDGEQQRQVRMMQQSAESLHGLITDILDISKIEAGAMEIQASPFQLRDLVEQSVATFGSLALNKGLILNGYCPPGLPGVIGDFGRLRQVLNNLVSNAIKCTQSGKISVLAHAMAAGIDHVQVELRVEDTGVGLTAAEQQQIFERFSQSDTAIAQAQAGSGLGLSISRALIEQMHGQVDCQSVPEKGSCFSVRLTLPRAMQMPPAEIKDPQLTGLRIKVIAADPDETQHLRANFEALGCILVEDDSAQLHVEACQEPRPDLPDAPMLRLHNGNGQSQLMSRPVALKDWRQELRRLIGCPQNDKPSAQLETQPHFANARIIVAEDNAVNRSVIKLQLNRLGCEVTLVEDGKQAAEAMAREPFDLLITDIRMPVMDGHALTEKLRRDATTDRRGGPLPILAMTANVEKSQLERCQACGMDEVLTKPLSLEQLTRALQRWLPTRSVTA